MRFVDQEIVFPSESYIERHWRGHHTLMRSFWLNLMGMNLLMMGGQLLIDGWLATSASPLSGVIAILFWAFALLVWIWGAVGVWRTAARYSRRPGAGIWGRIASAFVVLQGLSIVTQTAKMLP